MENLNLILFLSIVAPMSMMLFVCEKRARFILGFILIGIFVCLFSSELSGIIFGFLDMGSRFLTINVTPFTEELLKAIPVLILVFSFDPDNQQILEASIAVGVGFAILENAFILAGNVDIVTISLALIRGFGAGMMHGLCTFTLGYGLTIIRKKRKFFFTGTVAFLSISIMYHSLYNILVQSDYQVVGFVLPILTFVPLLIVLKKRNKI